MVSAISIPFDQVQLNWHTSTWSPVCLETPVKHYFNSVKSGKTWRTWLITQSSPVTISKIRTFRIGRRGILTNFMLSFEWTGVCRKDRRLDWERQVWCYRDSCRAFIPDQVKVWWRESRRRARWSWRTCPSGREASTQSNTSHLKRVPISVYWCRIFISRSLWLGLDSITATMITLMGTRRYFHKRYSIYNYGRVIKDRERVNQDTLI